MEKDNLNLENLLEALISELPEEKAEEIWKCYKNKKIENYDDGFIEADIPKDFNSRKKISPADIKAVRDDEDITEFRGIISLNFEINDKEKKINITSNIGKNRIEFLYPMSRKNFRKFAFKYRNKKKLLGKVTILYSPTLNTFSLHRLKVFAIQDPLKKWEKLMEGKTLLERIDVLVSILGLNPEKMLYHEKIIAVMRLIPLVVKKVLMVDFSKKGIGKTHSYLSLDLNLYSINVTKASAFIDGRGDNNGNLFYEDIAFIIDEAHRVKDEQVFIQFQNYMNGNKYEGEIVVSGNDKRKTDVSPIFLGNIKDGVNLLDIYSDNKDKFGKAITLFSDTAIENTIDRGEAFVSRITLLPNSWGCREFSSSMKAENVDSYNIELLKAVIPVLREKELDIKSSFIKEFYERIGETWRNPNNRSSEGVEKNLEGLLKLLYCGKTDIPYYELLFLLERSVEMRVTVDNTLKKINPYTNKGENFPNLDSDLKKLMFRIGEYHVLTPHRIFIKCSDGRIEKQPLDAMGIELNKKEEKILVQKGYQAELKNDVILIHNSLYTRNFLTSICTYNNIYPCTLPRVNQATCINHDIRNLSYNFLTGEYERLTNNDENLSQKDLDFIVNYSFYDIAQL